MSKEVTRKIDTGRSKKQERATASDMRRNYEKRNGKEEP